MRQPNGPASNVQGSNPDVAEGGLDVEGAFAALDQATDRRLRREAQAHAETEQAAAAPGGTAGEKQP